MLCKCFCEAAMFGVVEFSSDKQRGGLNLIQSSSTPDTARYARLVWVTQPIDTENGHAPPVAVLADDAVSFFFSC